MNIQLLKFLIFAIISLEKISAEDLTVSKSHKLSHKRPEPSEDIPANSTDPVQTEWIEQQLDHFNDSNTQTWQMRYMTNLVNFQPQSPIFIFIGGEWDIDPPDYITASHFYDVGKELNAAFYYTEHRYYGESKPTDDISTDNLQYINTKQALADLLHFITFIRSNNPDMSNSKIVLAGGSYSGAMVTWFRRKYPDLTVGGWASSTPLFAKVDYQEYNVLAGESVKLVCGTNCYNRIKNGIKALEELLDNDADDLIDLLNICPDFDSTNKYDVWNLFKTLANTFTGIIQGYNKHKINKKICKKLADDDSDDMTAIANWFVTIMNASDCNQVKFRKNNDYLKVEDWDYWINDTTRVWTYQTCTEFGYFQSSKSRNQPFGSKYPVQYFIEQCKDVFGISQSQLYNNIASTNDYWGAWQPNVTNVYFTNGGLDPWRAMALRKNADGVNNVIPWYSHFQDLWSISPKDTTDMVNSKIEVRNLIRTWVGADTN